MNPSFSRHRRYPGAGLQRRRHQLLFLRRAPATPPLNRGDDLDPFLRHVTIPVNSHMTHTLTQSTRRPLTDGYTMSGWSPSSLGAGDGQISGAYRLGTGGAGS